MIQLRLVPKHFPELSAGSWVERRNNLIEGAGLALPSLSVTAAVSGTVPFDVQRSNRVMG